MSDIEDDQFPDPEDHPGPDEDGVLPEGENVPDRDSSWMSLVSWVETLIASVSVRKLYPKGLLCPAEYSVGASHA